MQLMADLSLITHVRSFIRAHRMLDPGASVVVGVSGGPDSLCLLHVLLRLCEQLDTRLHVAHLDHMIRGAESAAEAEFVASLAREWGVPITIEAVDVPALARARKANLHAAVDRRSGGGRGASRRRPGRDSAAAPAARRRAGGLERDACGGAAVRMVCN
jgi:tRNA(Ile)-lysidine synthase TilS/MesJ